MPTGYEVQMYQDIHNIARALHKIAEHLTAESEEKE